MMDLYDGTLPLPGSGLGKGGSSTPDVVIDLDVDRRPEAARRTYHPHTARWVAMVGALGATLALPASVAPAPPVPAMSQATFAQTTVRGLAAGDARLVAGRLTQPGVDATVEEAVRLGLVRGDTPHTLAGAEEVVRVLSGRLTPAQRQELGAATVRGTTVRSDGGPGGEPAFGLTVGPPPAHRFRGSKASGGTQGFDAVFYVNPSGATTRAVVYDRAARDWVLAGTPMGLLPGKWRAELGMNPAPALHPPTNVKQRPWGTRGTRATPR